MTQGAPCRWRRRAQTAAVLVALAAVAVLLAHGCSGKPDIGASPMAETNRLIDEKSPYLLQHAHNPVNWHPWGEEAFQKARQEDRPIFLSVGYSTCHWCHVMERESFEDEAIAEMLNAHFVAIKVDREERPDIDDVYMSAVQVLTQRGGWPMSVFLLPDGRPFYGGTYFPKDRFARVLTTIAEMYRSDRGKLDEAAGEVATAVAAMVEAPQSSASLHPQFVKRTLDTLHRQFDAEHGGFGGAPKFPPHTAIELLFDGYRRGGGEGLLAMATLTLEKMALGGIHDHIGGGFHRYSIDERWFVPHFEKMLYDNALLARNYVEAYRLTQDELFRETAEAIFEWIEREMTGPEGSFYSALDAESEGVEGQFYVWRQDEIEGVLGHDAPVFLDAYGVEEKGNFTDEGTGRKSGENVLHLKQRLEEGAIASQMAAAKAELLAVREGRPRPALDDKVIASWNGLMIGALAYAGRELEEPNYTKRAERSAEFIVRRLWKDGRLLRRWRDGEARFGGALDDYVFVAYGLIELYESTGERRWLERAREMMDGAIDLFWDEPRGGFFSTADDSEPLFVRPKDVLDNPLPSGNGMAARILLRIAEATGERKYGEYAERTLRAMAPWMERAPYGTETLALAAGMHFERKESMERKEGEAMEEAREAEPQSVTAERHPVKVTAKTSKITVTPGEPFEVEVTIAIAEGWHINSRRPTVDFLVPTAVGLREGGPFQLGEVEYPDDTMIELAGDQMAVYEGTMELVVPVTVLDGAHPGPGTLGIVVQFQACDNQMCQAPDRVDVELPVVVATKQNL